MSEDGWLTGPDLLRRCADDFDEISDAVDDLGRQIDDLTSFMHNYGPMDWQADLEALIQEMRETQQRLAGVTG